MYNPYTKQQVPAVVRLCCIVFLFVIAIIGTAKASAEFTGQIATKRKVTIYEVPYLVQLTTEQRHFYCAGTLISDQHVVTAARCLKNVPIYDIRIVANSSHLHSGGIMRKVVRIDIHPKYDPVTQDRDVAVLKMDSSIPFGKGVKKLGLCKGIFKDGDTLEATGWGDTKHRAGEPIGTNVKAVNHVDCNAKLALTRTMECAVAAVADGKDLCQGFPGTPTIVDNRICGVVLYGHDCGGPGQFSVYTNITTVRRFVRESMEQ